MVTHYLQLDSAKYVNDFIKREEARVRRARNRKAAHDFFVFLVGLAAMPIAFYAVVNQQHWVPIVQRWISQTIY